MSCGIIIIIFLIALHSRRFPSTDDAYVQAHSIQIATQVSGTVDTVLVDNHQSVKKNQLLFTIDPKPFQLAVDKATADLAVTQENIAAAQAEVATMQSNIKERQAQLVNAQKYSDRVMSLVNKKLLSKADGDDATARLETAKASVEGSQHQLEEAQQKVGFVGNQNMRLLAAQKNLEEAQLNLSYTKVYAPCDGSLNDFNLQKGATVLAGKPLFIFIDTQHWWVDADYKETQLSQVRPNQKAIITVDLYPHHPFHGIVSAISVGSTASYSLLPPEDSTGNWVKVTQRFPVQITILDPDPRYPLRVGASSTVSIDTKS